MLMKNRIASSRVLGLSVVAALLAVSACSDDDDSPDGTSGSAGMSGSSLGGSGGKAGSAGIAGTNSPSGGKAGSTQGGTAGTAGTIQGGMTGEAGGGGAADGGVGGELGSAGAPDSAGAGAGGMGGSGGEGGAGQAAECDYVAAEDDSDQATGISVTSTIKTICAHVNNGNFASIEEGLVDRDGFEVDVAGADNILIRVEIPGASELTEAIVFIDGWPTALANGRAAVRKVTPVDDTYVIALRAYNDVDIAEPLPYKVTVVVDDVEARCPTSVAAATFTEAGDGIDSRGNDVYEVDDNSDAAFTAAADAAEATGITVAAPPVSYRIDGTSADNGFLDPYYDTDSYLFHTGPDATQVTLRADWSGDDRDMDLFLFKAGEEVDIAAGLTFSKVGGEYVTAAVEPDTDYVVWNGLYEGSAPFDYSLTLCSEAFSLNGE
jgi:hypothetical protein